MHFQSSDSSNQHHHIRPEIRITTLNVEEFLHAYVCTKSCFCNWSRKKKNNSEVCERLLGREISALVTEIRSFFWDRKKNQKTAKVVMIKKGNLPLKNKQTPHTYQQNPLYPQASALFCLPTLRNSHVQYWQKVPHEQTQGFPRKWRRVKEAKRNKENQGVTFCTSTPFQELSTTVSEG